MADARVTITVVGPGGETDVAVVPLTAISEVVATVQPQFRGRVGLSSGTLAAPWGRIGPDVRAGTVLTLLPGDGAEAVRLAQARAHTDHEEPRRAFLRAGVWTLGAALVVSSWVMALARSGGAQDGVAWAQTGVATVVAVGLLVWALGAGTSPSESDEAPGPAVRAGLAWGLGWAPAGGVLVGGALGRVVAQALALTPPVGAAVSAWLVTVLGVLVWVWHPHVVRRTAAWAAGLAAAVVTATVLLPGGPGLVVPGVVAVLSVLVVIAPRAAPQVPDDQLVNVPLLLTSAPQARGAALRRPGAVTRPRVNLLVSEANTMWSVVASLAAAGIAVATWPLTATASPAGRDGWSALVMLVAAMLILAFAPAASTLPVVRAVPRLAAVAIVVEWALNPHGAFGALPGWAVMAGLTGLALVVLGATWASTRPQGAPLLGRAGDVALVLAEMAVIPAAILASGLFDLIWHAVW
ncbi:MAG: hypothetical protein FWC46_02710 [Actinomycetia bacterium]|nr:hypothetical protein [Actinomycetes bacterium]